MSTKPIREALALVREDKYPEALKRALESVEAIEKAAKGAYRGGVTHHLAATDTGLELAMLLESIAKEAP